MIYFHNVAHLPWPLMNGKYADCFPCIRVTLASGSTRPRDQVISAACLQYATPEHELTLIKLISVSATRISANFIACHCAKVNIYWILAIQTKSSVGGSHDNCMQVSVC